MTPSAHSWLRWLPAVLLFAAIVPYLAMGPAALIPLVTVLLALKQPVPATWQWMLLALLVLQAALPLSFLSGENYGAMDITAVALGVPILHLLAVLTLTSLFVWQGRVQSGTAVPAHRLVVLAMAVQLAGMSIALSLAATGSYRDQDDPILQLGFLLAMAMPPFLLPIAFAAARPDRPAWPGALHSILFSIPVMAIGIQDLADRSGDLGDSRLMGIIAIQVASFFMLVWWVGRRR
jgi:hypothetical protein